MTTCDHTLKSGKCQMPQDHRGRHSTVTFECDACGKTRRGQPHTGQNAVLGDGSIDDTFHFCFMCAVVEER